MEHSDGTSVAYENTGSASSPTWTRKASWDPVDVGLYASPFLVDMDNDGDNDLMIGEYGGVIKAYENTGSGSSPVWIAKTAWDTPDTGTWPKISFGDLDGDGDSDFIATEHTSGVNHVYENTGSASSPVWTAKAAWNPPTASIYAAPMLVDLDNDL